MLLLIGYKMATLGVLINRGGGWPRDIVPITNLALAYKVAGNMAISAPSLSILCGIALYGDNVDKEIKVRNRQTFLYSVRTNTKSYNPLHLQMFYPHWLTFLPIYIKIKILTP